MSNPIVFSPIFLDQIERPNRSIITQLPFVHQTDTLKRFFNSSVNHLFNPGGGTQINGYIGNKPSWYNSDQDFYITEPTANRQFYQLEACMVSKNTDGEITDLLFYPDIVNQLRFQGAITTNHNRLFEQDFYAWCPPVDPDMLINFNQYFWVETDDRTVDYMVIERGSDDGNPWSVNNLWYHKDDLTPDQLAGNITQAARPIVQFQKNLELFNYGTIRRLAVSVRVDSNDFGGLIDDANTAGHTSITIDGVAIQTKIGADTVSTRILITNDKTTALNNKVYELTYGQTSDFNGNLIFDSNNNPVLGIVAGLTTDGVNPTGDPAISEIISIENGNVYGGTEVYFDGSLWANAQQKSDVNFAPLFNLYDVNNIALNDPQVYPNSTFAGCKLFNYSIGNDNSGVVDPILKIQLTFDNNGQINFENYIVTSRWTYTVGNLVTPIIGFYFHKTINSGVATYGNDWFSVDNPTRQMIVDQYVCDGINTIFKLSQVPDPQIAGQPDNLVVTRVAQSQTAVSSHSHEVLVQGVDYVNLGDSIILQSTSNNDLLTITTFSQSAPFPTSSGFYEVAPNLRSNPDNEQVSTISTGDIYHHFSEILQNQIGFIGKTYSTNNWRSTAKDQSRGRTIIQHSASLLNLALTLERSELDFMNAARYVEAEYMRVRNRFEQKITQYFKNGKSTLDIAATRFQPGKTWQDVWVDDALLEISKGKTQTFPFAYSGVAASGNNVPTFLPATPSYLGIYPLYIPEIIVDYTFESQFDNSTHTELPKVVIQNHDGSLTPTYGRYDLNDDQTISPHLGIVDPRDQVILELETRIYNSVNDSVNTADRERPICDWLNYYSGYSRKADYTYFEYLSLLQPAFDRWVNQYGLDYRTNSTFELDDPFTWNWSQITGLDGNLLPGNWRGIALYYFDTDRPHTHPWEMLGFTGKPDYWDELYGASPYTSNNFQMWTDLENGYIASGPRMGINPQWARKDLSKYIPVDELGNLFDPVQMGIAQNYPLANFANEDWKFGDCGPIEATWRRSPLFAFAVAQAAYLMKPARFFGAFWDANNFAKIHDQFIDVSTRDRPQHSELQIHGERNSSNQIVVKYGIQQWISDYVVSLNKDVKTTFADPVRNLNVQLAYKVAGFTDTSNLFLTSEAFDRVPAEDVSVQLYKSPSIREEFYSGVIIDFDGRWFRVFGYDTINPRFLIVKPNVDGPGVPIQLDTPMDISIPNWKPKTWYIANVVVNHTGTFYSCVRSHTSSQIFEDIFWQEVSEPSYVTNQSVIWYLNANADEQISIVPYGSRFSSLQDVANFLNGLERCYVRRGWIFYQILNNGGFTSDWSRSCLEFLSWYNDIKSQPGSFIALSPSALQIKFNTTQGEVQSIEQFINGTYSLLDRYSKPIKPINIDVARTDGEVIVIPNSDVNGGIFGCRLYVSETEHVITINNRTIFQDIVYDPLLNIRQPRFRLQGFKTTNWHGRINAPGFIVTGSKLIPNFEKSADDFRHLFSVETIDDNTLQQRARNNIGYAERDYLNKLLLTPTNQFEFYQGMIQQKGTPAAMNRLLRSNFVRNNKDIKFFEEWAFRIGDYGSSEINPNFALQLKQSDVTTNPQLIEFNVIGPDDTVDPANNVIQVIDITGNQPIRDPRWIWRANPQQINWQTEQFNQHTPGFLPSTGYVNVNEISWTAANHDDLINLYYSTLLTNPAKTIKVSYDFEYDGISTSPSDFTVTIIPNLTQGYLRINSIEFNVTECFLPNSMSIDIGRQHYPMEFGRASPELLNLGQDTIIRPFALFELNEIEDNTVYLHFNYYPLSQYVGYNIGKVTVTINAEQFTTSVLPNHRCLVYNDIQGDWNTYKLHDTSFVINKTFVPSFTGQGTPISLTSNISQLASTDLLLLDGVTDSQSDMNLFASAYNPVFSNIARVVINDASLGAAPLDNENNSEIAIFQMLSTAGMTIDKITVNVIEAFTGGTAAPQIEIGTPGEKDLYVKSFIPSSDFIEDNPQITTPPSFNPNDPVEIDIYDTSINVAEGTNTVPVQVIRSGNIYLTLTSITITNTGSGYITPPQVVISGPQGVQAVASLAGPVRQILITNGGTGYTSLPLVTIVGANGAGCTATASILNGQVTAINVTSGGNNYTSSPSVIISGGGGIGATATATVNYGVTSIAITSTGGCLYDGTLVPAISFVGGGGSGAAATANLTGPTTPMTVNWRYYRYSPNPVGWTEGGTITFPSVVNADVSTNEPWSQIINVPVDNPESSVSIYQVEIYNATTSNDYQINQGIATITVAKTEVGNNSVDLTIVGTTVIQCGVCQSDDILTAYVNANGNLGIAVINVDYHYEQGFEAFNVDGSPYVSSTSGYGGRILGWYKTRFANIAARDAVTIPNGWEQNDIVEIDYVADVLSNGGWAVYARNQQNSWTQIRTENLKIDSSKFVNAIIYNDSTDTVLQTLQLFDPYKGYIVGSADRELTYKENSDPAIYNNTNDSSIPIDEQFCWGLKQVNQLWWDLSTVRYIDYEQSDSVYKWRNWGRLAPGITIDLYEWVRSPVPPSDWSDYVSKNTNVYAGFSTTPKTGYVLHPDACGWVEKQEWIPALNRETTAYYFWVKDVADLPNTKSRHLTAVQVASIILNPSEQDIPWFAAINPNQLIIGGIKQYLNDTDTILKLNWKVDQNEGNYHKQWELVRENDTATVIDARLWNKMRDSLVGWDTYSISSTASTTLVNDLEENATEIMVVDASDLAPSGEILVNNMYVHYAYIYGNTLYGISNNLGITAQANAQITQSITIQSPKIVPDPALTPAEANGNFIRPRQSWFPTDDTGRASRYARQIFVEAFNTLMQAEPYLDTWYQWQSVFGLSDPQPDAMRYSMSATSLDERDLLASTGNVQFGQMVLVTNTETTNFWSLWRYESNNSELTEPVFTLVTAQRFSFDEGLLWNKVDWYDSEWSILDFPLYHVSTAQAFGTFKTNPPFSTTLLKGTLVMVDNTNENDGIWSWHVYNNGVWKQVAKHNGTVALSSVFYDPSRRLYGLDDFNFSDVANRDGSWELRGLLDQIPTTLFTNLQMNNLFFAMTRCALSQTQDIDWVMKTSFMSIGGYAEPLQQNPLSYVDQAANIISYIEEVKPYHVKIREYLLQYTAGPDVSPINLTDFDSSYTNASSFSLQYLPDQFALVNVADQFNPALSAAQDSAASQRSAQAQAVTNAVAANTTATPTSLTPFIEQNAYAHLVNSSYEPLPFWNGLRHGKIKVLFDRVACSELDPTGWDNTPWDDPTQHYTTQPIPEGTNNVTIIGTYRFYRPDPTNHPDEVIILSDSAALESPALWDYSSSSSASIRIQRYYQPTVDMKQLDFPNLINGCDFRGVIMDGGPFAYGLWDMFPWDFEGGWANEEAYYVGSPVPDHSISTNQGGQPPGETTPLQIDYEPGDLVVDGGSFNQSATDIANQIMNFDGGFFVDPLIQPGHPEELVKLKLTEAFDNNGFLIVERSDAATKQDPTYVPHGSDRSTPPANAGPFVLPLSPLKTPINKYDDDGHGEWTFKGYNMVSQASLTDIYSKR